jgi:nucleoside-diphosphate-sugar epimerase
MRVLVAGASGAVGTPVVRMLVAAGHSVDGLTRTAAKAHIINELGARPIIANALDPADLRNAVLSSSPDAVVHALTAIPARGPLFPSDMRPTNLLRVEGTRNLLDAAIAAGARRIIAESMVFIYGFGDFGASTMTEDRGHAVIAPKPWLLPSIIALVDEERQILEASRNGDIEGVVLRFGGFYGPRTGFETLAQLLKKRLVPICKGRSAAAPWIHIHDAASAIVAALDKGASGDIYNIVDDMPAPFVDVIDNLVRALGAPRPRVVPISLVRLIAPFLAASWLDTTMRVSNLKAKRDLQWTPRFPSYHDGIADFAAGLRRDGKRRRAR